jgi:hypothetical protein
MRIAAFFILFLFAIVLQGQTSMLENKPKTKVKLETAYLNTFSGNIYEQAHGFDFTIGLNRSKLFNERFAFDYGLGLGFTAMDMKNSGSFFLSRFRGQLVSMTSLEKVRQLNLNIPLNISFVLKQRENLSTKLVGGVNTQLNFISSFEGNDWGESKKLIVNQFRKSELSSSNYRLLNDLRFNAGAVWSLSRNHVCIDFGLGFEYSYYFRNLGAYSKVAYSFDWKK